MTCYFCQGNVEPAVLDYMTHDASGYTLVKDLHVDRCTQCGELYFDTAAMQVIEDARKHRAESTASLSIPVVIATVPQPVGSGVHADD